MLYEKHLSFDNVLVIQTYLFIYLFSGMTVVEAVLSEPMCPD